MIYIRFCEFDDNDLIMIFTVSRAGHDESHLIIIDGDREVCAEKRNWTPNDVSSLSCTQSSQCLRSSGGGPSYIFRRSLTMFALLLQYIMDPHPPMPIRYGDDWIWARFTDIKPVKDMVFNIYQIWKPFSFQQNVISNINFNF